MRIFATLLSVVLLSIPGASLFSQDMMMDGTGFYVAAGGGATLITDTTETPQSATVPGGGANNKADWDLDFGFSAGGSAGYDFGDFRTEAEFSFQSANFRHDEKIDNDKDDQKADDNLTVIAVMANGFFDLDTGTPFVPFIGIGVGAVNLSVKLFPKGDADQTGRSRAAAGASATRPTSAWPTRSSDAVALTLGYKFFGTLETEVTDAGEDDDEERRYVRQADPAGAPRRTGRPVQVLSASRTTRKRARRPASHAGSRPVVIATRRRRSPPRASPLGSLAA